jgi:hypothetical protein
MVKCVFYTKSFDLSHCMITVEERRLLTAKSLRSSTDILTFYITTRMLYRNGRAPWSFRGLGRNVNPKFTQFYQLLEATSFRLILTRDIVSPLRGGAEDFAARRYEKSLCD